MLSVFVPSETSLKKVADADLAALPESAVWIDLVKPTAAEDKAVAAGADRATLNVVEVEDLPLAYLPGNSLRTRVRVVGEIAR